MALLERQVSVGGLLMGPGTPYRVLSDLNPWSLKTRAEQSGGRAWGHGGWSGAEWAAEKVVPLTVAPVGATAAAWLELQQQLSATFSPVGDSGEHKELRFEWGGREFLLLGRPRMVEPQPHTAGAGVTHTKCAFVALDPLIYDGSDLAPVTFGLPKWEGGFTFPLTFPFTIPGVAVDGEADLVNEGTAEHGMQIRIDGPVAEPRLSLVRPGGVTQTLRMLFDLSEGQWVEIDTAARTVLLNGLPQANRRGQVAGVFPMLPGRAVGDPPAVSTLRFRAAEDNDEALLTVFPPFSAWW